MEASIRTFIRGMFLCFVFISNHLSILVEGGTESNLLTHILTGYDTRERPVHEVSDALTVRLGIALKQILEMNEKRQTMTVSIWMRQFWNDYRFQWDPADFNGTESVILPMDSHWKPDVVIYNNADKTFSPAYEDVLSIVDYRGDVVLMYPIVLEVICLMNVYYFPFDEQTCYLKFGSWAYNALQLELKLKETEPSDIANYQANSGWGLVKTDAKRQTVTYGCCSVPYDDVQFHVTMRRQWTMLFFHLLLPCLICNILAVAQFILPCDSGEKVTLAITLFLSMVVYMLLLQEMLPNATRLPIILHYMGGTLALVCVSMVVTVIVLHIHHNGYHDNHMQLPHWARSLFLHQLSKFVFLHKYITSDTEHENKLLEYKSSVNLADGDEGASDTGEEVEAEEGHEGVLRSWSRVVEVKDDKATAPDSAAKKDGEETKKGVHINGDKARETSTRVKSAIKSKKERQDKKGSDVRAETRNRGVESGHMKAMPSVKSSMFQRRSSNFSKSILHMDDLEKYQGAILFKILKHCEDYKERISDEEKDRELQCEWMQLAMVIDRLMLGIYFVFTMIVVLYLLCSKPSYTDHIIR